MARPLRAPELVGAGGWINTPRPLSLAALRGRVVVLHFLRFSCISCLRVVEELRRLQERFAEEAVVVGVHCPSSEHERDHEAVARAVARHRVDHPVLDDPEGATASAYAVKAVPTVVLVNPLGRIVGTLSGEGVRNPLEKGIEQVLEYHAGDGSLVEGPLDVVRVPLPVPLAYPSDVTVSPDGTRLAIADTAHDQVVVCTRDGVVLEVHTGYLQPRGVTFAPDGAVLACDSAAGRIVRSDGEVVADAISAPWDVAVEAGGTLVVAEAGRHRLLRVKPGELRTRVAAGTGAEGEVDGPAATALLAQPSGVARVGEGIAFVDAEGAALRLLGRDQTVVTLAADGLEHPTGVAASDDGRIFVADPFTSTLWAWDGRALAPLTTTEALTEPEGLDVLPDGRLVVADTGACRVVVVDPATGEVEAIQVDERWVHATDGVPLAAPAGGEVCIPVEIGDGGEVRVTLDSRPRSLLRGAPVRTALVEGRATASAGGAGHGMLLVEVQLPGGGWGRRRGGYLRRYRHPFTVTPA